MAIHIREKELQNLGLTEKEAKVYLASLELGESPVQDIARKAGVNRATTYVMIEQLTAKGLMTSVERGKKRYFFAESPDKIATRVRLEIAELEEKMSSFKRVLPDLHALYDTSGEKPRVRFFEGEEGIINMLEDIHETLSPGVELRQVIAADDYYKMFGTYSAHDKHKDKLFSMDFHVRRLFTTDHEHLPVSKPEYRHTSEARRLPKGQFPFSGELVILKNKIYLFTYSGKIIGIIIESEQLASLISSIFDLAWIGAEKVKIPGGYARKNNIVETL
ncbi:MAG: helix-turn-helix domain-containing protein [bacterium]